MNRTKKTGQSATKKTSNLTNALIDQENANTARKRRNSRTTKADQQNKLGTVSMKSAILNQKNALQIQDASTKQKGLADQQNQQNKQDKVSTNDAILNQKKPLQNQDATVLPQDVNQRKQQIDLSKKNAQPTSISQTQSNTDKADQNRKASTKQKRLPDKQKRSANEMQMYPPDTHMHDSLFDVSSVNPTYGRRNDSFEDNTDDSLSSLRHNVRFATINRGQDATDGRPNLLHNVVYNQPSAKLQHHQGVNDLSALMVGTIVEAQREGGTEYFTGMITGVNADDTYNIDFGGAGNEKNVNVDRIRFLMDNENYGRAGFSAINSRDRLHTQQNQVPLFKIGDYVKFRIREKAGESFYYEKYVGYITEIGHITYKVKAGIIDDESRSIRDIKEYSVRKGKVSEWEATPAEKSYFLFKNAGANFFDYMILLRIGYFFAKLAGLFYKITSNTNFVLLRSKEVNEAKTTLLGQLPEDEMLKHVIQIRKECPQYWKKIKWEFEDKETQFDYLHLDADNFYRLFFKVPMSTINNEINLEQNLDDEYTYFIAIYELEDNTELLEDVTYSKL